MTLKISSALITPSPTLVTPFSYAAFPNILAAKVSNNYEKNYSSCFFASVLIVLLIPFISNPSIILQMI